MRKVLVALAIVGLLARQASAHDIYTGLRSKQGLLCCGGNDCAATTYRESGGTFEFLTREQEWIGIPEERIQFLPIPGDAASNDSHRAHMCYRAATEFDRNGPSAANVFGDIYLYCAFIPPGSI